MGHFRLPQSIASYCQVNNIWLQRINFVSTETLKCRVVWKFAFFFLKSLGEMLSDRKKRNVMRYQKTKCYIKVKRARTPTRPTTAFGAALTAPAVAKQTWRQMSSRSERTVGKTQVLNGITGAQYMVTTQFFIRFHSVSESFDSTHNDFTHNFKLTMTLQEFIQISSRLKTYF